MNFNDNKTGNFYESTYTTKPTPFLPKIKVGEFSPATLKQKGKRIGMPYR